MRSQGDDSEDEDEEDSEEEEDDGDKEETFADRCALTAMLWHMSTMRQVSGHTCRMLHVVCRVLHVVCWLPR